MYFIQRLRIFELPEAADEDMPVCPLCDHAISYEDEWDLALAKCRGDWALVHGDCADGYGVCTEEIEL